MAFITFTRADDSPVSINTELVVKLEPVPADGATAGPLKEGTRIHFENKTHQDVKELLDVVEGKLNAARG